MQKEAQLVFVKEAQDFCARVIDVYPDISCVSNVVWRGVYGSPYVIAVADDEESNEFIHCVFTYQRTGENGQHRLRVWSRSCPVAGVCLFKWTGSLIRWLEKVDEPTTVGVLK
jgi:hypothetical protein